MRRISGLVLAALLAVTAAACGSGAGSSSRTTTTTATTAAPTTTVPEPSAEDDRLAAKQMVVTLGDLPQGFKEVDNSENDGIEGTLYDCSFGDQFLAGEGEVRGASSEFQLDEPTQVMSTADFAETEQEVRRAFGVVSANHFRTCINDEWRKVLEAEVEGSGVRVINVATTSQAVTPSDGAVSLQVVATFGGKGGAANGFIDMVFIKRGRVFASLLLTSPRKPYEVAERNRLAGLMAARMEQHGK